MVNVQILENTIRRPYVSKHLSEKEIDKWTERLVGDPTVALKTAVQGIKRRTVQIVDSAVEINPILGCYIHWMQSVQRISSNHNTIPYDEADKFRHLVYTIRTTKDAEEFCRSWNEVVTCYKNSYKWLQWWLQPSISSMIFRHCTGMDDNLPLPQILSYIRSDERILANYEKHAVPATYNRAPRATHKRPSRKTVNDGRPPDVTDKLIDKNI
ncbi:hypothetical protein BDC45DRAFT_573224 [Circinella umbellata]|nr:hypothetical protein BDC45DRAFT_573224 [Circinella umbellata]